MFIKEGKTSSKTMRRLTKETTPLRKTKLRQDKQIKTKTTYEVTNGNQVKLRGNSSRCLYLLGRPRQYSLKRRTHRETHLYV